MRDPWHQKIDAVTGRFACFPFAVHPVADAPDWVILVDQRPAYADEAWIVLEQPAAVCAAWEALPSDSGSDVLVASVFPWCVGGEDVVGWTAARGYYKRDGGRYARVLP